MNFPHSPLFPSEENTTSHFNPNHILPESLATTATVKATMITLLTRNILKSPIFTSSNISSNLQKMHSIELKGGLMIKIYKPPGNEVYISTHLNLYAVSISLQLFEGDIFGTGTKRYEIKIAENEIEATPNRSC